MFCGGLSNFVQGFYVIVPFLAADLQLLVVWFAIYIEVFRFECVIIVQMASQCNVWLHIASSNSLTVSFRNCMLQPMQSCYLALFLSSMLLSKSDRRYQWRRWNSTTDSTNPSLIQSICIYSSVCKGFRYHGSYHLSPFYNR